MALIQCIIFFYSLTALASAWLLDYPQSLQARSPPKKILSNFKTVVRPQADPQADVEPSLPETFSGKLIVSDTVDVSEMEALYELIQDHTPIALETAADAQRVTVPLEELPPGVTGRVAMIVLSPANTIDEENLMYWQVVLSQQIDEILYSPKNDSIRQPILHSLTSSVPEDSYAKMFLAQIHEQIEGYGLVDSVMNHHYDESIPSGDIQYVPSLHYEVDGAMVQDKHKDTSTWDTSSVLVFDDMISSDLRHRMLQVVLGDEAGDWDDAKDGPCPSRWAIGGLIDLPEDGDEEPSESGCEISASYGLTDEAIEEICEDDPVPAAFEEFEKILVSLFQDFVVTRLPEAFLGAEVTPLTANAPCYGQEFNDHIDADPFFAPPSPWTDVFGRYANRATGKPRFVSCLVYLSNECNAKEWGAPTRFYDVATETSVDISPKPGRVVIMDQDVTHTVVAPLEAAGNRPRYSLVWKLALHPKLRDQDMRQLAWAHSEWPEAVYVGSAKR